MRLNREKYNNYIFNKTNNFFLKAFTLTEVIIASFISAIVLSFIFIFLYDIINGIGGARREVVAISSFYDFTNKINNYRNVYLTGGILIDNSNGSDVFLMKDFNGENGILIGPVGLFNNKLNVDNNIYEDKGIGFRKMSSIEINAIETDVNNVYDLSFQEDKIFKDLKVKDFSIESYNMGKVIDLTIVVNLDFQTDLIGQSWDELPKDSLITFNIDF